MKVLNIFAEMTMFLMWQVYRFMSDTYNFLMTMANLEFKSDIIDGIINTLYLGIGIFMLFRIAVNMLQYLVDPDKLTDKSVGGGKIAVRVIISIVLFLTLNSFIFPIFDDIQVALLGNSEKSGGLLYRVLDKATKGNDSTVKFTYSDNSNNKASLLNSVFNIIVPEVKADDLPVCFSGVDFSNYGYIESKLAKPELSRYDSSSIVTTTLSYIKGISGCKVDEKTTRNFFNRKDFYNFSYFDNQDAGTNYQKYADKMKELDGNYPPYFLYVKSKYASQLKVEDYSYVKNWNKVSRECNDSNDTNCHSVKFTVISDASKDGEIDEVIINVTRSNLLDDQHNFNELSKIGFSYADSSLSSQSINFFENARVDIEIKYYSGDIYGKQCYYVYIGDNSNTSDDSSYKPALTYIKVKFHWMHTEVGSGDYVHISFENETNEVTLNGTSVSANSGYTATVKTIDEKIKEINELYAADDITKKNKLDIAEKIKKLLKSKGYDSKIFATSADFSQNFGETIVLYDKEIDEYTADIYLNHNNEDEITDDLLEYNQCPDLIRTGGDLECKKVSDYDYYNSNSAPIYACRIGDNDTIKFSGQKNDDENQKVPRFTCGSLTFNDLLSCISAENNGFVKDISEDSAFSIFNEKNLKKINDSRIDRIKNDDEIQNLLKSLDAVVSDDDFVDETGKLESEWHDAFDEWNSSRTGGVKANDIFAGILLSAFVEVYETNDEVDYCLKSENILRGSYSDKKCMSVLIDADDDDKIYVSAFIGMIVGIIVVALLVTLCVDIVVRHAKLILLKIMSPIAVMSFINPKDKIFPQWMKMFLATFADLFIKVLAISLIPILLTIFGIGDRPFMVRIFIVLGILTFAKAAPSFISKMFGISDMAGSFKDAGNMLKTAAFTAAGAGLAVGAAGIGVGRNVMAAKAGGLGAKGMLAAGLRGTAGIFGAGLRGAGGGMKGNVMAGAKGAWATAGSRSALYQQGVGAGAQMIGGIGLLNYADHVDRKNAELENQNKELEEFNKHKKNMEDAADSSSFMKTIRDNMSTGKINMTDDQYKAIREKYMNRAMEGGDLSRGDLNRIMSDASASGGRILTDEQLANIGLLSSADASGVSRVKEDGGLKAALNNELTMAVNDVKGSKLLGSMIGGNDLSSFTKLKDFSKDTKAKQESNKVAISATHNDRYTAADKARKAKNGGK